jgi:hypothetical protein
VELTGTITVSWDRVFTPQTYCPNNHPLSAVFLVIGLTLGRAHSFWADSFFPEAKELRRVAI